MAHSQHLFPSFSRTLFMHTSRLLFKMIGKLLQVHIARVHSRGHFSLSPHFYFMIRMAVMMIEEFICESLYVYVL